MSFIQQKQSLAACCGIVSKLLSKTKLPIPIVY